MTCPFASARRFQRGAVWRRTARARRCSAGRALESRIRVLAREDMPGRIHYSESFAQPGPLTEAASIPPMAMSLSRRGATGEVGSCDRIAMFLRYC